jgi:hypothetical protein
MKVWGVRSLSVGALAILGLAVFLAAAAPVPQQPAAPAAASEVVLTLDPTQSRVHWTVDSTLHTVHGSESRARTRWFRLG